MREKVGVTDQAALSQLIGQLATHVSPLTLGTVNRQYSHIRALEAEGFRTFLTLAVRPGRKLPVLWDYGASFDTFLAIGRTCRR